MRFFDPDSLSSFLPKLPQLALKDLKTARSHGCNKCVEFEGKKTILNLSSSSFLRKKKLNEWRRGHRIFTASSSVYYGNQFPTLP